MFEVCFSACLSVYLFACRSVCSSACLHAGLPVCLSVSLVVCLSVCLFACHSARLHACLLVCLSAQLSIALGLPVAFCLLVFGLPPFLFRCHILVFRFYIFCLFVNNVNFAVNKKTDYFDALVCKTFLWLTGRACIYRYWKQQLSLRAPPNGSTVPMSKWRQLRRRWKRPAAAGQWRQIYCVIVRMSLGTHGTVLWK